MSTIELADGFPRDSIKINILFHEIELAHRNMVSEISLRGKHGGYRIVEKDEFPTITIVPVLMPYKLEGRYLVLPVFLDIFDKENNRKYKKHLEFRADLSKDIWKWINIFEWFNIFIWETETV